MLLDTKELHFTFHSRDLPSANFIELSLRNSIAEKDDSCWLGLGTLSEIDDQLFSHLF